MKKIILAPFLLISLFVIAQKDSSFTITDLPDSTAIGKSDGNSNSKEIGPSGGTIRSEDGRMELVFPAGALTSTTTISIQPTFNHAPNGTGKSYWFEPSGIQFHKPVQIIFHYSEDEAERCAAELMGLAIQDKTGKWEFIDYEEWDSVGKKLKGFIEHFSGASNVAKLKLNLVPDIICVETEGKLSILDITPKFKKRPMRVRWGRLSINQGISNFEVNGVPNGDDIVGHVYADTNYIFRDNISTYTPIRTYEAPRFMPEKNPVKITAWIALTGVTDNVFIPQKQVSCIAEIYDEYKVLITDTFEARVGMGTFVCDTGTFKVRVTRNNVIVTNVQNYPPYSYVRGRAPVCKLDVYVGAPCEGTIHIKTGGNGQALYSHQRDIKSNPPFVLLSFSTSEVLSFRFWMRCPGTSSPVTPMSVTSVPGLLRFQVNGERQRISISTGRLTPYNINVIPLRE